METQTKSTLEVSETAWAEIPPLAADLNITLRAERFFSGNAALSQAEELRRLSDALKACGIEERHISLVGAMLHTESGLFTKSSSVTYRVRIHLTDPGRVTSVLDVIANAKKATLTNIEWDYEGPNPAFIDLLRTCSERAQAKASLLAQSLGTTLKGVHTVREERIEAPEMAMLGYGSFATPGAARASASLASPISTQLEGLDLAPKKKIGVRLQVVFALP